MSDVPTVFMSNIGGQLIPLHPESAMPAITRAVLDRGLLTEDGCQLAIAMFAAQTTAWLQWQLALDARLFQPDTATLRKLPAVLQGIVSSWWPDPTVELVTAAQAEALAEAANATACVAAYVAATPAAA